MFADYPQEQNGSTPFPSEPWMELSEPGLSDFLQSIPASTESPLTAGFDLGSGWPLLAIMGVGALVMLRGGKKKHPARRRSRRKRKR